MAAKKSTFTGLQEETCSLCKFLAPEAAGREQLFCWEGPWVLIDVAAGTPQYARGAPAEAHHPVCSSFAPLKGMVN